MTRRPRFDPDRYDPKDPDPWLALWLDVSTPVEDEAKAALLRGEYSLTRRLFLPVAKPFIFVWFILVRIFRRISPKWPNAPKTLHNLIHWGLKSFATPDANTLVLRHFNIGTEILSFIQANSGFGPFNTTPLRPRKLEDLKDNVFLQHDLNVYIFIAELSMKLRETGRDLEPPAELDFSMISDAPFEFEPFPDGPLNVFDIQTAIEMYAPLYALFLPDADYDRAANSLQLDETFAIYVAKLLGTDYHLSFVANGHPTLPEPGLTAARRLMLHGLDAEGLHGFLRLMKKRQADGLPLDPRAYPGGL